MQQILVVRTPEITTACQISLFMDMQTGEWRPGCLYFSVRDALKDGWSLLAPPKLTGPLIPMVEWWLVFEEEVK